MKSTISLIVVLCGFVHVAFGFHKSYPLSFVGKEKIVASGQQPVWKIHKYSGIQLKPVAATEVDPIPSEVTPYDKSPGTQPEGYYAPPEEVKYQEVVPQNNISPTVDANGVSGSSEYINPSSALDTLSNLGAALPDDGSSGFPVDSLLKLYNNFSASKKGKPNSLDYTAVSAQKKYIPNSLGLIPEFVATPFKKIHEKKIAKVNAIKSGANALSNIAASKFSQTLPIIEGVTYKHIPKKHSKQYLLSYIPFFGKTLSSEGYLEPESIFPLGFKKIPPVPKLPKISFPGKFNFISNKKGEYVSIKTPNQYVIEAPAPTYEVPPPAAPESSYGVPATEEPVSYTTPSNYYGVPSTPSSSYGVPLPPPSSYGVPSAPSSSLYVPSAPSSSYSIASALSSSSGVPSAPSSTNGVPSAPSSTYGVPSAPTSSHAVSSVPASSNGVPSAPSSSYGVPAPPSSSYGVPSAPSSSYGVPLASSSSYNVPQTPSNTYGVPSAAVNSYSSPSISSASGSALSSLNTPSQYYSAPTAPLTSYGSPSSQSYYPAQSGHVIHVPESSHSGQQYYSFPSHSDYYGRNDHGTDASYAGSNQYEEWQPINADSYSNQNSESQIVDQSNSENQDSFSAASEINYSDNLYGNKESLAENSDDKHATRKHQKSESSTATVEETVTPKSNDATTKKARIDLKNHSKARPTILKKKETSAAEQPRELNNEEESIKGE